LNPKHINKTFCSAAKNNNEGSSTNTFVFKILFFFLLFFLQNSAIVTHFSGVVVDTKGQPTSKTIVHLQGTPISTFTDQKGHFIINLDIQTEGKTRRERRERD